MRYFKTVEVDEATAKMLEVAKDVRGREETVPLSDALDRILAKDIYAPYDLPSFRRSTVDGYAVRAKDTVGASESMPAMLTYLGEVHMGEAAETPVTSGHCIYVPTGGMVPEGADSMLMIEYAKEMGDLRLCYKSTAVGDHMIYPGEDAKKEELLLKKGMRLTPGAIGICAALSYFSVPVIQKPTFTVFSTGDEIAGESEPLLPGKIRDINTYTIASMIRSMGGEILETGLLRDKKDALIAAVQKAAKFSDFVLLSGGSSVGTRDYTRDAIEALPEGELLFHGLNVKPGKPTLAGFSRGTWVIGLPGHPVSAMWVLKELLTPYWEAKYGQLKKPQTRTAVMAENMPSSPGKRTMQTVTLREEKGIWYAKPFYSASALISQFVRADGMIVLPKEKEGLYKGDMVEVELL